LIKIFLGIFMATTLILAEQTIKIASYNVENLFDLRYDRTEYVEYIPNTTWQWNQHTYQKKLTNLARVIGDMHPDVIALQEIESLQALKALRSTLKFQGHYYQYYAIANAKQTTVKNALLSKYPITYAKEIAVTANRDFRAILEVKLNVHGHALYLFINHWKSKAGPESMRVRSAKALRARLETIGHDQPILLLGDFNSDYQESETFIRKQKLNDTHGMTGINHTLQTQCDGYPASLATLSKHPECYYNLWYELPEDDRWSHIYRKNKEALDHMIISSGLTDGKGIDYVTDSFQSFTPDYLFTKNGQSLYRWQRSRDYPKHHTGKGYSDHLPISAQFKVANE
jgi:endonuclease/exonuclease/phosphatase family metal-dependent hydrolase